MNNCQRLIIDKMVVKAAEIYNLSPAEITTRSQKVQICIARQLIWAACKNELSISYRGIGKQFNRNCKAVFEGVKNINNERTVVKERSKQYKELVGTISLSMQSPFCKSF